MGVGSSKGWRYARGEDAVPAVDAEAVAHHRLAPQRRGHHVVDLLHAHAKGRIRGREGKEKGMAC